jgi:hypothetical protein
MASKVAKKPEAEPSEIIEEETRYIRAPVSLSTYRALVMLSAQAEPFTRFNDYCADVLTNHVNQQQTQKRKERKAK